MQAFMHRFFRGLKHRPYLSATFALGFVIFLCCKHSAHGIGRHGYKLAGILQSGIFVYDSKDDVAFRSRAHLRRAKQQDEGKWMILTVALIAMLFVLFRLLCSSVMFPKIKQSLKRF
jgi:hypothetical protein